MYSSIKGLFENGKLILLETPPTKKKSKVVITFLEELQESTTTKRRIGGLEGKIGTPEDFNEPINDLNEYMF